MLDVALLLGPVAFRDFEVPAGIVFGGGQRLAVHRLVGGGRVIDTLGRDDGEIAFSGIFSGSDATLRARLVDELRAAGAILPLTWDVFFYSVVIARFEANYENAAWIPYRLTCTVLRDEASTVIQTALSLATDLLSDIASGIGLAAGAGFDLTTAQTALAAPGATVRGTAAFMAAQTATASAQSGIAQAIGTAETALGASGLGSATTASAGVAGLGNAVGASQILAGLTAARGYLGRTAVNLANAST